MYPGEVQGGAREVQEASLVALWPYISWVPLRQTSFYPIVIKDRHGGLEAIRRPRGRLPPPCYSVGRHPVYRVQEAILPCIQVQDPIYEASWYPYTGS